MILFLNAFWTRDAFTGLVIRELTLDNFAKLAEDPSTRRSPLRTVVMAALVTVTCAVLAFPIAFYMARVASPRVRGLLPWRRPHAALGELPGQGLCLAR